MRELEKIGDWHLENLFKLKEVFTPEIEMTLSESHNLSWLNDYR